MLSIQQKIKIEIVGSCQKIGNRKVENGITFLVSENSQVADSIDHPLEDFWFAWEKFFRQLYVNRYDESGGDDSRFCVVKSLLEMCRGLKVGKEEPEEAGIAGRGDSIRVMRSSHTKSDADMR